MEYSIQDAIQMIGELHYQKRMLEVELATVREQSLKLLSENESAKVRMAELEATLNGQGEGRVVIEND